MHIRRFTNLTKAFSKKMENHCGAIDRHLIKYSFEKIIKTLWVPQAMEAGLNKAVITFEDNLGLVD